MNCDAMGASVCTIFRGISLSSSTSPSSSVYSSRISGVRGGELNWTFPSVEIAAPIAGSSGFKA